MYWSIIYLFLEDLQSRMAFVLRILHGVHEIYATVTDTIRLIKSNGKGSFLRKHTLKMHAFRIVPIPTEDHYLLAMKWQGMYYYDRCLPMGPASSCKTIEISVRLYTGLVNKNFSSILFYICLRSFFLYHRLMHLSSSINPICTGGAIAISFDPRFSIIEKQRFPRCFIIEISPTDISVKFEAQDNVWSSKCSEIEA